MSHSIYGRVVALTGIRHSGKSTAAKLFSRRGATVVSADDLAREAVTPGSAALARIEAEFGARFVDASGALDRKALAAEIYRSPERRSALERIVHPIVRDRALVKFEEAVRSGAPLVVYDCPLFFEAGLDALGFQGAIVLDVDPEQVVPRIMARDHVDEAEARRRLGAQLGNEEKVKKARWVLPNRGSLADLETRVNMLYDTLTAQK